MAGAGRRRYGDAVTLVRAPLVAGYGGAEVRDWDNATRTVLPGNVQPVSTTEDGDARQTTVSRWRAELNVEPTVLATDRVEWEGLVLEVDGEVELHKDRRGRPHHRTLLLRRAVDAT